MLSPPMSSRRPTMPPPPSESLLAMQRMGLELTAPRSWSSINLTSTSHSGRSNPSDLDKPLPLEPNEEVRRSSSIYSNETTISDIISLYGGDREEELPPMPNIHQPQAYRDTLAPLLVRHLSFTEPLVTPDAGIKILKQALSNPSIRVNAQQSLSLGFGSENQSAPSFVEFSRNLRERRAEINSPLSATTTEIHRQAALDQLAPQSPNRTVGQSANYGHDAFYTNSAFNSVSHIVEATLVSQSRDFDSTIPVLKAQEADRTAQYRHLDEADKQTERKRSATSFSTDSFVIYTGVREVLKAKFQEKLRWAKSADVKENERVMSHASEKYPGMKSRAPARKFSLRSRRSRTSSFTKGASDLSRKLSSPSPSSKDRSSQVQTPRRQKQLAIPATPYQKHGAEVWFAKNKKRRREERRAQRALEREGPASQSDRKLTRTGQSDTTQAAADRLSDAYHNGQNEIVGVLEAARKKLTRSSTKRRQERLKRSITLLGPTELTTQETQREELTTWL